MDLLKFCKKKLDKITSAMMIGNIVSVSNYTREPPTVLILSPLCWFSLPPRLSPDMQDMSGCGVWVGSDVALLQLSRNDCHCIHIRQGREVTPNTSTLLTHTWSVFSFLLCSGAFILTSERVPRSFSRDSVSGQGSINVEV